MNVTNTRSGHGFSLVCDRLLLPVLLLIFAGLSFFAATRESVTIDEFRHLATGVYYWQSGNFSFDNATPPLWKLAFSLPAYLAGAAPVHIPPMADNLAGWQPWFVATEFMKDNRAVYTDFLTGARSVNIIAACCCLGYLYRRCRSRFGAGGALFGTAFLAFSPTLLAHSHYATTDIIAMLTMTVLVFWFIDLSRAPGWSRLLATSVLMALAILCKFSAVLLLPPFLLALALGAPRLEVTLPGRPAHAAGSKTGVAAVFVLELFLSVVVVLLVLNVTYGFRDTGVRLKALELQSRSLQAVSATLLGELPLPVPKGLVEGFDRQKADSDEAEFPSFLMGNWSGDGFRSYYAAAFCLKETLPFILMLLLVPLVRIGTGGLVHGRTETVLLWYVPVSLFIVLGFMNRLDVGIRYLLPAYPFICYFYGRLFAAGSGRRRLKWVLLALLALHVLSALWVAPRFTTYFNELAGGPQNGHRYLIDSNLDWGQGLIELSRYLRDNGIEKVQLAYFGHALPEFYGISFDPLRFPPRPGYVAISASLLMGQPYLLTYEEPPFVAGFDFYRFMRVYRPLAQVGNSIMIYRIEPTTLQSKPGGANR